MKRNLCKSHSHLYKEDSKPTMLSSTKKCTFCRRKTREPVMRTIARKLESAAIGMKMAHEDPYYDPFGYGFRDDIETAVNLYLKMLHPDYLNDAIETMMEGVKNEKK